MIIIRNLLINNRMILALQLQEYSDHIYKISDMFSIWTLWMTSKFNDQHMFNCWLVISICLPLICCIAYAAVFLLITNCYNNDHYIMYYRSLICLLMTTNLFPAVLKQSVTFTSLIAINAWVVCLVITICLFGYQ